MGDDRDDSDAWDALDADDDVAWDDEEADGDEPTAPCPECGAAIYDDAVRCPVCGSYVSPATHRFSGPAWWWIALGIVGVLAAILVSLLQ